MGKVRSCFWKVEVTIPWGRVIFLDALLCGLISGIGCLLGVGIFRALET